MSQPALRELVRMKRHGADSSAQGERPSVFEPSVVRSLSQNPTHRLLCAAFGALLILGVACGPEEASAPSIPSAPSAPVRAPEEVVAPDPDPPVVEPGLSCGLPPPAALELARLELRQWVLGGQDLPSDPPDDIREGASDEIFASVTGLSRVETLRFQLDYGFETTAFVFWPRLFNDTLVLYHLGHQGHGHGVPVIEHFVERGHVVAYVPMPMFPPNASTVDVEIEGERLRLTYHAGLEQLERRDLPTFQLFFETPSRVISYLLRDYPFRTVAMIGISGGGWTADFLKAMDPRLDVAYSIAGSLPFDLREPVDLGDFEQLREREVYDLVSMREIYYLAAQGSRFRQILYENDECCFAWRGREDAVQAYVDEARACLQSDPKGGDFGLLLVPDRVAHDVHEEVLEWITRDLEDLELE